MTNGLNDEFSIRFQHSAIQQCLLFTLFMHRHRAWHNDDEQLGYRKFIEFHILITIIDKKHLEICIIILI